MDSALGEGRDALLVVANLDPEGAWDGQARQRCWAPTQNAEIRDFKEIEWESGGPELL